VNHTQLATLFGFTIVGLTVIFTLRNRYLAAKGIDVGWYKVQCRCTSLNRWFVRIGSNFGECASLPLLVVEVFFCLSVPVGACWLTWRVPVVPSGGCPFT
jgi:hypothetical protein